jgi:hypothetical protein
MVWINKINKKMIKPMKTNIKTNNMKMNKTINNQMKILIILMNIFNKSEF